MKFAVGDRVRVYGYIQKMFGSLTNANGAAFVVDTVEADDLLFVTRLKDVYYVHPKQCRRIKKKELRRIWVEKKSANFPLSTTCDRLSERVWILEKPQNVETVEFVEVRK